MLKNAQTYFKNHLQDLDAAIEGVLKNLVNFTGKHLWSSLFLIKLGLTYFEEHLGTTASEDYFLTEPLSRSTSIKESFDLIKL